MDKQTVKRYAVFAAAAGLSTWALDMAATQMGLPSMQAALGVFVTASQWILNLTLMIVAGLVTMGGALLGAGLIFSGLGLPAQYLWQIVIGAILGSGGFSYTNPVQMAALSETPLEQRGMLADIFPRAGNFGTAFWVALLTAGLGSLMGIYMANNPGASEAAVQASALGILSWIGLVVMLVTLFVALKLNKAGDIEAESVVKKAQPRPAAGK
jgi:hypothetical protein